jgi:dTDP-glucose pyrophosphorylase/predicted transcriptional regulator
MSKNNLVLDSFLIRPEASIRDAISAVDRGGIQLAVVVDERRRILGTITDGDIRRALIRKVELDTSVSYLMNRNPQVANEGTSRKRIIEIMEFNKVSQIPVVDSFGRIVHVETLHSILNNNKRDNIVFIMAGGFGSRLQPLTQNCPKPLLNIGEKAILEIIIENFIKAGFHRYYISLYYLPEMIRERIGDGSRWGIDIQYVQETEPLGTGGALSLLPADKINGPFIMINADLLTALDYNKLIEFHNSHDAMATLCVREIEYRVPYGVVSGDGVLVDQIVEKPTYRYLVNAGIYALSPSVLKYLCDKQPIDMPNLLQRAMADGEKVNMFPVHEYWLDIGRIEDFNRAQHEIKRLIV